ncbi:ferredoxin domain-containing protein [Desulfitispora alkaliphila]|uniref:ferredoxin domain-containing protein n=1 Tax=Desulfitispora alkaliphila TaxID=622674 RepID=UPI003D22D966
MKDAMKTIAGLMAVAARTAPKTRGKDYITAQVITGAKLREIADEMVQYGKDSNKKSFDRDGENVRNSDAMLLLGIKDPAVAELDCGACGVDQCSQLRIREGTEFDGPLCAWRTMDLGIAIGSAVKIASIHNADNRIMYRVGAVVRKMGLVQGQLIVGIPISATGKNIFFDR